MPVMLFRVGLHDVILFYRMFPSSKLITDLLSCGLGDELPIVNHINPLSI